MTTLPAALTDATLVLDGGLATELEARGHDLSGGLWSARLLLADPGAVAAAHRGFFEAGAQVATTASYQASGLSLARAGLDPALADGLLARSVQVARRVRDEAFPHRWVAGSVGPYGASLADGSEYTGAYDFGGHDASVSTLRAFHRPRMEALLAAGCDVLACETVPLLAEVEALAAELRDLAVPAWVSVTVTRAPDGDVRTRAGDRLDDVAAALRDVQGLLAVGVNCCQPEVVVPALGRLTEGTGLPGVAYPNRGESWNAAAGAWSGDSTWDAAAAGQWVAAGARMVGGCCRVTPADVGRVATAVAGAAPSGPTR